MARLDEYVLGFHRGRVAADDTCKLINVCLKCGICSDVNADGEFTVRRKDRAELVAHAKPKLRFELSQPLGLFGAVLRFRYCYGAILALVLTALIFLFSSARVWDVRIEGNERLTDREIENYLSAQGFSVGALWRKVDKNKLENAILSENKDVAWISVNRRGTVAYVRIAESENVGIQAEDGPMYSNLVAERDGVIEEIIVESGVAAVKVGDVVRAGDVLISGVVENEKGTSFCRARGSVRASCVTNLTAEASESYTERVLTKHKLRHVRLFIFNFSINIFKNYGNSENGCDIIKENRSFALFNRFRLPIRIEKIYTAEYEERERLRSADEMTEVAKRQLDDKIYSMFKDADVIKLRTEGSFGDGVYRITARVVYSTDIGKESAIEIN